MGSYFSSPTPDSASKTQESKKPIIYIGKVPEPNSSMIGWTYCMVYPDSEETPGAHHMETGTMGQIYRSSWSHLKTHQLQFLESHQYFYIHKPTMTGLRQERIKVEPFSESERTKMEDIMNSDNDVEFF